MYKSEVVKGLVGVALLAAMAFLVYKGLSWVFVDMLALSPKKLAFWSLTLVAVPVVITLLIAIFGSNAANSSPAYYSILLLPFGVLGLVIAGFWYVIGKFIN